MEPRPYSRRNAQPLKIMLLKYASFILMTIFWSLSSLSGIFSAEEQQERNLLQKKRRTQPPHTPPILTCPMTVVGQIGKFLKESELLHYFLCHPYIRQCAAYAREHRTFKLHEGNCLTPKLFQKLHDIFQLTIIVSFADHRILEQISTLHKIRHLTLKGLVGFTDADLQRLRSLTNLQSLSLVNLNVTDTGIESLREYLPNLEICYVVQSH
ncbi:MAG: hypothetical protein K0R76_115 [Alphaproteobacteria bacterium]|jgi:hypothetical protein|nr:hypothetical protein [Alphaproteobacteria bacterium]